MPPSPVYPAPHCSFTNKPASRSFFRGLLLSHSSPPFSLGLRSKHRRRERPGSDCRSSPCWARARPVLTSWCWGESYSALGGPWGFPAPIPAPGLWSGVCLARQVLLLPRPLGHHGRDCFSSGRGAWTRLGLGHSEDQAVRPCGGGARSPAPAASAVST